MWRNHRVTSSGFTLVELIAVMVIVAVISTIGLTRLLPASMFQLQAGRDQLVSALFHAQQKALFTAYPTRLTTLAGVVDIRQDVNGDALFSATESVRVGAVQYPLTLVSGVQMTAHSLDYNALGETSQASITLTKGGNTVVVAVSQAGFAQ